MVNTIEFSPAIPLPPVFGVQKRTQELRGYLDPSNPQYQPEQQHVNIKTAIKLYEDGKIDGLQHVCVMEGEIVTQQEMLKGSAWAWAEGRFHQFAQKFAYGHGPFGPHCHELRMLLGLMPHRRGDGTAHGIIAMNDTGSDILSVFDTDMSHLGSLQGYAGWLGQTAINNAKVRDDNSPWSDWINDQAIAKPIGLGAPQLSGVGIRDVLYPATAPGNHFLAVSTTKGGLTSLL